MKRQIRTPYFEIGTKNYVYGDDVLKMLSMPTSAPRSTMWTWP